MEKKYYMFCVLILLSQYVFSQQNAVCIYKIEPISESLQLKKSDKESETGAKKLLLNALNLAKEFDVILRYNGVESISNIEIGMANESIKSNYLYAVAEALVGKGAYYQNNETKIRLRQVESMGTLFVIRDSLNFKWNITNISKKIGRFNCYKALLECNSCHGNGSIEEVWFTPEIPASFGPLGYGNLPGLIIELKKKTLVIRLKTIEFKKEKIQISKFKKGKFIELTEYNNLAKRVRSTIKK